MSLRRGRPDDVPQLVALIAGADLPPLFIEEFIGGFAVAETAGEIIACGGAEFYEDCAVIRSIVVDARARGTGHGRRISELLVDDIRASGGRKIYLFTGDAHPFWLHLGFQDIAFEDWQAPARACWQYRFIEAHRGGGFDPHTLWKPV